MKDLKFGPITEKMEGIVVEGQYDPHCATDCRHTEWSGHASSQNSWCSSWVEYDASGSYSN